MVIIKPQAIRDPEVCETEAQVQTGALSDEPLADQRNRDIAPCLGDGHKQKKLPERHPHDTSHGHGKIAARGPADQKNPKPPAAKPAFRAGHLWCCQRKPAMLPRFRQSPAKKIRDARPEDVSRGGDGDQNGWWPATSHQCKEHHFRLKRNRRGREEGSKGKTDEC
jgi:hypothetical protein